MRRRRTWKRLRSTESVRESICFWFRWLPCRIRATSIAASMEDDDVFLHRSSPFGRVAACDHVLRQYDGGAMKIHLPFLWYRSIFLSSSPASVWHGRRSLLDMARARPTRRRDICDPQANFTPHQPQRIRTLPFGAPSPIPVCTPMVGGITSAKKTLEPTHPLQRTGTRPFAMAR